MPKLGYKQTDEHRKKGAIARLGRKYSDETRQKISLSHIGNKYALGYRWSEERKKAFSEKLRGKKKNYIVWNKGKTGYSTSWKGRKQSESMKNAIRGAKHFNWKGGITSENNKERFRFKQELQDKIFIRDNYICQECGERGKKLQVHHIMPWSQYKEKRFEISNCITLCIDCHYRITYNRARPIGALWGIKLS